MIMHNVQHWPIYVKNLLMKYSRYAFKHLLAIQEYFIDCMVFFDTYSAFKITENSHLKCFTMSYVHHIKDPRVCPTGSLVQCCPSLSRGELYLPTTHTEKENRSFIESFNGQQLAWPLTKTDRWCHMQSHATIFFTPSDCLTKQTPNNNTPTHPCQNTSTDM